MLQYRAPTCSPDALEAQVVQHQHALAVAHGGRLLLRAGGALRVEALQDARLVQAQVQRAAAGEGKDVCLACKVAHRPGV